MTNTEQGLPALFREDPLLRGLITPDDEGHWLWDEERLDSDGYGYLYRDGYMWRAHRWVWLILVGWTDLTLDHLCRKRRCVNPNHLEPVTQAVNNARKPRPETCPQGHIDWVIRPSGARRCRECHRIRERNRRARSAET